MLPLEFDGRNDSVFHPFNRDGERHMEYLRDHGQFPDVPEAFFFGYLRQCYPHLFTGEDAPLQGDMRSEAAKA